MYSPGIGDINFQPDALFKSGDHPTMWKTRHSKDHCIVKYPGLGNPAMVRSFCKRMGGKIPKLETQSDVDRMKQAGSGI